MYRFKVFNDYFFNRRERYCQFHFLDVLLEYLEFICFNFFIIHTQITKYFVEDLENTLSVKSGITRLVYIAIILIACGILFDVVNLIAKKIKSKIKTKNNVTSTEVPQEVSNNDNVTVPRHELKQILRELYELKSSTNASLSILEENATKP